MRGTAVQDSRLLGLKSWSTTGANGMVKKIVINRSAAKINRRVMGGLALMAAGSLAGCATSPSASGPVVRTGTGMISSLVAVPAGYDTFYLSGTTGTLPAPEGSPPGAAGPDSGDTEAQAVRAIEKIKATLAEQHLTLGDIVMMHAYLSADPKTGHGDFKGWTAAYTKYFGTPEQPNKPSRTSITVVLGNDATKIEIETIAVRKPK
jgi:enamine deaminase RidA (YjgF/YER057c/UK114 family)